MVRAHQARTVLKMWWSGPHTRVFFRFAPSQSNPLGCSCLLCCHQEPLPIPYHSCTYTPSCLRITGSDQERKLLVQAEAYTQVGSRNCSRMGDSSPGSPSRLRDSPLLCWREVFFCEGLSEHGECGTLDCHNDFHGYSGMFA